MPHPRLLVLLAASAITACGTDATVGDAGPDGSGEAADLAKHKPDLYMDMWHPTFTVQGRVLDATGKPVSGASVQICSGNACTYKTAGPDGTYQASALDIGNYAVKVSENCDARTAEPMALAAATMDGQVIDVGDETIPTLPAGVAIPPATAPSQDFAVGNGLTLTLAPKDFLTNITTMASCTFAAALVPPSQRPTITTVPDGGKILAVYALSPFDYARKDAASTAVIGVKATLAATPGAEIHFWPITASPTAGMSFDPVVIGHADAMGATVSTDPGTGITELTWLVIAGKP